MHTLKRLLLTIALLLLAAVPISAQTILNQTTLASAVTAAQDYVLLTSTASVAVGDIIFVDKEAMEVVTVNTTTGRVMVSRRVAGRAVAHATGSIVFTGVPARFYSGEPSGACTATAEQYLPHIVLPAGTIFHCISSKWVQGTIENVGAKEAVSGLSVAEIGFGRYHQTVFTLTNVSVTVLDATVGVGTKIYTFPEGRVVILGSTGTATFTTTSALATTLNASVSCRWGVGTTTQVNATLATTEQDLLVVTTFTSSATINVVNTATSGALAASAQFDGTTTAIAAFFNISVPTATDIDGNATVRVNATVTITWFYLGDYVP